VPNVPRCDKPRCPPSLAILLACSSWRVCVKRLSIPVHACLLAGRVPSLPPRSSPCRPSPSRSDRDRPDVGTVLGGALASARPIYMSRTTLSHPVRPSVWSIRPSPASCGLAHIERRGRCRIGTFPTVGRTHDCSSRKRPCVGTRVRAGDRRIEAASGWRNRETTDGRTAVGTSVVRDM